MADKEEIKELVNNIEKFLNGDMKGSGFSNTHQIFFRLNEIHLGEKTAILTDDILERYATEEYFDNSILE